MGGARAIEQPSNVGAIVRVAARERRFDSASRSPRSRIVRGAAIVRRNVASAEPDALCECCRANAAR